METSKAETSLEQMQKELERLRTNPEGNRDQIETLEKDIDFIQTQLQKVKGLQSPSESFKYNPNALQRAFNARKKSPSIEKQIEYLEDLRTQLATGEVNLLNVEEETQMLDAIYQSVLSANLMLVADPMTFNIVKVIGSMNRPYDLEEQFRFVEALGKLVSHPKNQAERDLKQMLEHIEQNLSVARWVGKVTADMLLERKGNRSGETTPEQDLIEAGKNAAQFLEEIESNSVEDREKRTDIINGLRAAIENLTSDGEEAQHD